MALLLAYYFKDGVIACLSFQMALLLAYHFKDGVIACLSFQRWRYCLLIISKLALLLAYPFKDGVIACLSFERALLLAYILYILITMTHFASISLCRP